MTEQDKSIHILVDVKNTRRIKGEEIVQLYIGFKNSSIERQIKELKGFKRIFLESNQVKTVEFELNPRELAYYDIDSKKWVVEKLDYYVYVGPSSKKTDLLQTSFKII